MEQRNTEALFSTLTCRLTAPAVMQKFCSRARETAMAGRRFEEAQRVEEAATDAVPV